MIDLASIVRAEIINGNHLVISTTPEMCHQIHYAQGHGPGRLTKISSWVVILYWNIMRIVDTGQKHICIKK